MEPCSNLHSKLNEVEIKENTYSNTESQLTVLNNKTVYTLNLADLPIDIIQIIASFNNLFDINALKYVNKEFYNEFSKQTKELLKEEVVSIFKINYLKNLTLLKLNLPPARNQNVTDEWSNDFRFITMKDLQGLEEEMEKMNLDRTLVSIRNDKIGFAFRYFDRFSSISIWPFKNKSYEDKSRILLIYGEAGVKKRQWMIGFQEYQFLPHVVSSLMEKHIVYEKIVSKLKRLVKRNSVSCLTEDAFYKTDAATSHPIKLQTNKK